MHTKTLVVAGGGAAGFFCAVNAARMNPALRVILLEKSAKLLAKVKISGGGRCNLTHQCDSITEMVKCYPRGGGFLKKAFHHFFTADTIAWFSERGVSLVAEEDGRMFPATNSSQTIIHCLLEEAEKFSVEIRMNTGMQGINKKGHQWDVNTSNGIITADFICIATGGFTKSEHFNYLLSTGHRFVSPVPSLFTFNLLDKSITRLMGVSVENAQVKIAGTKLTETGSLLITHWGLSGHAVLRLSAWGARYLAEKDYNFEVLVNWCPKYNETSLLPVLAMMRSENASMKIRNRNNFGLPVRLWEYLLGCAGIGSETRWADLPARQQNSLAKVLCSSAFSMKGKTTFKEEFVTAGGVSLQDIDPNSMQSKLQEGLFFAGEIMDVDGITGGYNFQHAWTSGYLAAQTISSKSP